MKRAWIAICITMIALQAARAQWPVPATAQALRQPEPMARPWVFWYWMHGAVSKQGITADLEAMQQVGIGGAYLMPIKDTTSKIPFDNPVRQLTPQWWDMVHFAMQEASRLGLHLGMHVSDGFALAGGPWITPELSMQKLVWTKTLVERGRQMPITLPQPQAHAGFYKEVAVLAYPVNFNPEADSTVPVVTTSTGQPAQYLSDSQAGEAFKSDEPCWIQYQYSRPVTVRSLTIKTGGNTYQALRFWVQTSNNGKQFKNLVRLQPPRHGWQDADEDYTYALPVVTARYFRFVYDKEGTEPGAEDLDAAKWKPSLKVKGIYLSAAPSIHQYQAKNGSVWRVAKATTTAQVPATMAVPLRAIINLTDKLDSNGVLHWQPPDGKWMVVRVGHTSTGHTNYTGGGGLGLEADKFNPAAIELQFDQWFGKAFAYDTALARQVLKVFHIDSWECGSQNWTANFPDLFKQYCGYDVMPYLLALTGVPVQSAAASEQVLQHVRHTIASLVSDVFYTILKQKAQALGCAFSAEAVAPTMVSDGMIHYQHADLPMGEFWLNSPTHDKPNDMLDAIHGAHIYGKTVVQAEAFTSVRMNWNEHPGALKALGDRNFALGINKMAIHVFTHNPWMDKLPGITLDGVGLYYQRNQTWFAQSKAWKDYLTRCQALLQLGKPVADLAVFTGHQLPRRSILPHRLVSLLPGIMGPQLVQLQQQRMLNKGQPMAQRPDGVTHAAGVLKPEDWVDALNGYTYDSFNPHALTLMQARGGSAVLPGGASYRLLVIPGSDALNPNAYLEPAAIIKLQQLARAGVAMIVAPQWMGHFKGLKNVVPAPYTRASFSALGIPKDVEVAATPHSLAWTHRKTETEDIYFISNQTNGPLHTMVSFRQSGKQPYLVNPLTGQEQPALHGRYSPHATSLWLSLEEAGAVFVIFRNSRPPQPLQPNAPSPIPWRAQLPWQQPWQINLPGTNPVMLIQHPDSMKSFTTYPKPEIRYFSGTATYSNSFEWNNQPQGQKLLLSIDSLYNLATIMVNGVHCGTLWTRPYQADITQALKPGTNQVTITVTNTWHNRLIGDALLPAAQRATFTTAPFRLQGKPLQPAGIVGCINLWLP